MSLYELYQEVCFHLLEDEKPSVFLNGAFNSRKFLLYPFEMLHRLKTTPQSPKYHPEGNVWNHTMLVVDEAAKLRNKSKKSKVFMWAALLHDIGKPSTTKIRGDRITAYDHDKEGAKLAKEFILHITDDGGFADEISALVRFHMQVLFTAKKLPFADIESMIQKTDVHEVALLGLCDRLGRVNSNRELEEQNIKFFLEECDRNHRHREVSIG